MQKEISIYENELIRFVMLAILGCGLITLGSLIRIPFYPVPFTLQTFALFIIGLKQNPKQAFASAVCYLICATVGLPVLGGKINTLWMTGPCGGYLIAFPVAAYLIAHLRQRGMVLGALFWGEAVIFALGWIWLVPFVGEQEALIKGVLIFIPSGVLKALAAVAFVRRGNHES